MILISVLVLLYLSRSGSNFLIGNVNFIRNCLFQMPKIYRNYARGKNTKIGGNSRASCFKPIDHCRASTQFNMQKLKVHKYNFKALSTCK